MVKQTNKNHTYHLFPMNNSDSESFIFIRFISLSSGNNYVAWDRNFYFHHTMIKQKEKNSINITKPH